MVPTVPNETQARRFAPSTPTRTEYHGHGPARDDTGHGDQHIREQVGKWEIGHHRG
jgi:hypothetical protein